MRKKSAHLGQARMILMDKRIVSHRQKITLVLALLPALASAQHAIPDNDYNVWLLEKASLGPVVSARMAGVASYNHFQATATLAFSCYPTAPVSVELAVGVQNLGFNTDPYEGPSATTDGPITLSPTGSAPGMKANVSGFFGDGGPFDTGTPFVFGLRLPAAQIKPWLADAVRGQPLHITVPAAKGGAPMTVEFRWPQDNSVLKRVVGPCADTLKAAQHAG
jgi:hypothetical protein